MSLRLLKILVAPEAAPEVEELLEGHGAALRWSAEVADGRVAINLVMRASGSEPLLDDLEERFRGDEGFRLLFFPLEATVPRMPEKGGEPPEGGAASTRKMSEGEDEPSNESGASDPPPPSGRIQGESEEVGSKRVPSRIHREELYTDITELSGAGVYFLTMSALSSVVATAGLLLGDGAVIIGAMVIAPLIGPSMGTAFATTLGDLKLGRSTLIASVYGALVAFGVAFLAGVLLNVDPGGSEIVGRTRLTFEHLALALAAGAAGAFAMTQGKGAGLVGVMVAVALLPPLANAGLLLGDGHLTQGVGAMVLVAGNVVSVNLAATVTFLLLGVRPNTWWEQGIRKRAVRTAFLLWGIMLLVLLAIVWFAWGGEAVSLG